MPFREVAQRWSEIIKTRFEDTTFANDRKAHPDCAALMVKRMAKKGKHAGKQFWACSAYPRCKTVEAIKA
jgi:ssDNA-binding Zn-finger/Zn-ribbon topoisomerase 1